MTDGKGYSFLVVRIAFLALEETISTFPKKYKINAFFTLHKVNGS